MRLQNLYINYQIINPQWSQHSLKYFSTELSPILLDVYDSLKKYGTMGAIFRTGTKLYGKHRYIWYIYIYIYIYDIYVI